VIKGVKEIKGETVNELMISNEKVKRLQKEIS
jgi:hypothetical protein